MEDILHSLDTHGQSHVLKFYDQLTDNEKQIMANSIKEIDWNIIKKSYEEGFLANQSRPLSKIDDLLVEPLPSNSVGSINLPDRQKLDLYKKTGLEYIRNGKVAALLLSGGQGTRLGVSFPKGMYEVGSPVNKSLFQLQAERIIKLHEESKIKDADSKHTLWYVMTSGSTLNLIRDFFEQKNYFGLDKSQVVFFEQNTIPCLDFHGKVLLEDKHKIARSPNGNGGLFEALHNQSILRHMSANGVEFVHVYCVDNILVKVCDPIFMGYCISMDAEAGSKVVEKELPDESVGVICKVDGKFKVIEYSEVSEKVAHTRDEATGKLMFNAGNICDQFFRVDFLKRINGDKCLPYHIAKKKIPHLDLETGEKKFPTEPNGIKLEKFIFDAFEHTDKFVVWQVKREDEFSPIKNASGSNQDNPETALAALLRAYQLKILQV